MNMYVNSKKIDLTAAYQRNYFMDTLREIRVQNKEFQRVHLVLADLKNGDGKS